MRAPKTITRADLVDVLVERVGVSRPVASAFLEDFVAELQTAICEDELVKLSKFGNFVVRSKGQRVGRNPKTGEVVPITPRRVVTFRPSQKLRDRVNSRQQTAPARKA